MCDVADEPDLGAYDGNLRAYDGSLVQVHLQPMWEMPGSPTPTRVLTAVRPRVSTADLQRHSEPMGELVPTSLGGDGGVLAMTNLGLDIAPFVSGRLGEAVQNLHAGEVVLARQHSHETRPFVPGRDSMYTLVSGGRESRRRTTAAPTNSEQRCVMDRRE